MELETALTAVASRFEEGLDEIAQEITDRMRSEVVELRELEAPEIWNATRGFNRGSRQAQAAHLRNGRQLPESCPEPDLEAAHSAARAGMTLAGVLHAYRIGHAVSFDAWLESIEQLDLPDGSRRSCLRAVSRFAVAYDDRVSNLVGDEFQRAISATVSPKAQRTALLRAVLDGSSEQLEALGYELDQEHIGVIAWGDGAQESLSKLATLLGRRLLWDGVTDDILMAWMGSSEPTEQQGPAIAAFQPLRDCRMAIGEPGFGAHGFRRTHREAGDARMIATRRPRPVTLYGEVALESLALRNEAVAREFTDGVLWRLSGNGERSDQLFQTLDTYFATGQNAASTAAALGVHERTVARRLQTVESLLGATVNSRRPELELALRLQDLLSR